MAQRTALLAALLVALLGLLLGVASAAGNATVLSEEGHHDDDYFGCYSASSAALKGLVQFQKTFCFLNATDADGKDVVCSYDCGHGKCSSHDKDSLTSAKLIFCEPASQYFGKPPLLDGCLSPPFIYTFDEKVVGSDVTNTDYPGYTPPTGGLQQPDTGMMSSPQGTKYLSYDNTLFVTDATKGFQLVDHKYEWDHTASFPGYSNEGFVDPKGSGANLYTTGASSVFFDTPVKLLSVLVGQPGVQNTANVVKNKVLVRPYNYHASLGAGYDAKLAAGCYTDTDGPGTPDQGAVIAPANCVTTGLLFEPQGIATDGQRLTIDHLVVCQALQPTVVPPTPPKKV